MSDVTPTDEPGAQAWPPTIPPNTRTNATPQLDAHPLDHNQIADALTAVVARARTVPVATTIATRNAIAATPLDIVTTTVAGKAGRRYIVDARVVMWQTTTAGGIPVLQFLDGAAVVQPTYGFQVAANTWLTISGLITIDCGAADRTITVKAQVSTSGGTVNVDRGVFLVSDGGPIT